MFQAMAERKLHFFGRFHLYTDNIALSIALTRWDKSNRKCFESFAEQPVALSSRLLSSIDFK